VSLVSLVLVLGFFFGYVIGFGVLLVFRFDHFWFCVGWLLFVLIGVGCVCFVCVLALFALCGFFGWLGDRFFFVYCYVRGFF